MEEVRWAIKDSKSNKSPGFDGLTAEFYQHNIDKLAPILVDVYNEELGRLKLVESNKHGATRLIRKVSGIPLVSELRPITMLNCDYRILSKILANRILKVLSSVIKSPQSNCIKGANIC